MTATCLNCGSQFDGNYCSNCGQKATVKRLTASALLEDVFHFFTHLETGFLFTTWNFLVRPGVSSINFISGKRQKYQKPVSYFLIWTGLYVIVHNTIINHFQYELTSAIVSEMNIKEQSNILFRQHFNLFIIPVLLLSAFLLYYILAKPLYNFTEILTLSLYGAGTYFMMSFLSDFIVGYIFRVNVLTTNIFLFQGILSSVYNFWFSFDFFKRLNLRYFALRLIAASFLIAISGWLVMFYLPMAWLYLLE
jgi:hypothetical protein